MDPIQAQLVAMSMIPNMPTRGRDEWLTARDADGLQYPAPFRARRRPRRFVD